MKRDDAWIPLVSTVAALVLPHGNSQAHASENPRRGVCVLPTGQFQVSFDGSDDAASNAAGRLEVFFDGHAYSARWCPQDGGDREVGSRRVKLSRFFSVDQREQKVSPAYSGTIDTGTGRWTLFLRSRSDSVELRLGLKRHSLRKANPDAEQFYTANIDLRC